MMVVKRNCYRESPLEAAAPAGTKKECEQCGVSKPPAFFNRNLRHRESLNPICRQCQFNRTPEAKSE